MGRLQGRVALVANGGDVAATGIVTCLAREGAKVVIVGGKANEGALTASQAVSMGAEALFIDGDTSDRREIEAAIGQTVSAYGSLDILAICTAVGQQPCRLADCDDEVYDHLFELGIRSVFQWCQSVIPQFQRQRQGNILVAISADALRPRAELVLQGAAMGALVNFIKGLSMELAADGFRVNGLCIGAGDHTHHQAVTSGPFTDEGRELFRMKLPLGRVVTPQDVGEVAVFLASDVEARTITGSVLPVETSGVQ